MKSIEIITSAQIAAAIESAYLKYLLREFYALTFLAIFCNCWKKRGDAWLSPPSAWIGSMMIPATGLPFFSHFSINSSTYDKSKMVFLIHFKSFVFILRQHSIFTDYKTELCTLTL